MVVLYMAREEKLTHAPEQHASKAGILRAQDFGPAFAIFAGFIPLELLNSKQPITA